MRQEEKLKEIYGRNPGFSVPEGYFEELNDRILRDLPAYPKAPVRTDMSIWQKIKPYAYLAAMFAGIWLMMSVFHHVSSQGLSLDNMPESIADAMESTNVEYVNYAPSDNEYALENDISSSYETIGEFEKDFDYDFEPQYQSVGMTDEESVSDGPSEVLI